jgi:hypothetical protein
MKLQLPLSNKFVTPLIAAVVLWDAVVICAVGWLLYDKADSVGVHSFEGTSCISAKTRMFGDLYVVVRCERD